MSSTYSVQPIWPVLSDQQQEPIDLSSRNVEEAKLEARRLIVAQDYAIKPASYAILRNGEEVFRGDTSAAAVKADGNSWRGPAVLTVACAAIVSIVVGRFEPTARAEMAGGSTAVALYLWFSFSESRKRPWFWWFLTAFAAVHAFAFWALSLPEHHRPSRGDVLFVQIDGLLMLGIAALLKSILRRKISQH